MSLKVPSAVYVSDGLEPSTFNHSTNQTSLYGHWSLRLLFSPALGIVGNARGLWVFDSEHWLMTVSRDMMRRDQVAKLMVAWPALSTFLPGNASEYNKS